MAGLLLAILYLAHCVVATDIDFYLDSNECDSDELMVCEDMPENTCCYNPEELFHSCEATEPQKFVQALGLWSGNHCYLHLGSGSDKCWGVEGDIEVISGCIWHEEKPSSDVKRQAGSVRKRGKGCEASGARTPNFRGRKIGGKKYLVEIGGSGHEEYLNLTSTEEKNEFLVRRADKVKDLM